MSRALIAGAIFGAGLISGGLMIQSGAWREAGAASGTPRLLEQVVARVSHDYVDTVSTDELLRDAATGLVKELDDPYSALLTPERFRLLREITSGRYAGVGLELDMRDGFVTVIAPLAGTPADSAGIKPGDVIIAIDDKRTHGLSIEEVQQSMRGRSGTRVRLTLERGNENPLVTLTRRDIVYHPVQHAYVTNGIAYVDLATFSEQAAQELRRAIDSVRKSGARALILDLRGNPGGLLEEGLAVADLFIDAGKTIASTRGRTPDADHDYADIAPQLWPTLPIVALVDSGSASAAEIVAGALQDNDRAVLVGARTYGKGSAQSIFPVTGGSALKLTTARWFTPNGRTIARDSADTGGIEPDVLVTPAERPRGVGQRDVALARAVTLLTGVSTPKQLRARAPRR